MSMDNEQQPQPTSDTPQRKAQGGNLVWYMLGLGVLLLLILRIFNNDTGLTLGFSDLLKLVKASGKAGSGSIDIADPASGELLRISNLSNVVVGDSSVIAKVNRQFLKTSSGAGREKNAGSSADKGKAIEIRVDRLPEQRLTELLDE